MRAAIAADESELWVSARCATSTEAGKGTGEDDAPKYQLLFGNLYTSNDARTNRNCNLVLNLALRGC